MYYYDVLKIQYFIYRISKLAFQFYIVLTQPDIFFKGKTALRSPRMLDNLAHFTELNEMSELLLLNH